MKHIPNYSDFKKINESLSGSVDSVQTESKLNQAADIITSFLNKKTKKDFKKFPFIVYSNGIPGIMLYSSKDNSAVRIGGGGGNFPGVIGQLDYFSDGASYTADFSISSQNFPIVALVNEFTKLINEPSYTKEVETLTESFVNEGNRSFTPAEQKEILNRLNKGESGAAIAREMGVSYGMILQLKRNVSVPEDVSPAVKQNDATLADKVKLLDETLDDLYQISRRVAAGAFNSLMVSGRAGTGKTFSVTKALKDEGLVEDDDFIVVSGAVSVIMMYKKLFQYRTKTLVFDDCDAVFRDETGRNILKAALDTKKIRRISYLKKTGLVFDPKDFENNPEGEFLAIENGLVPGYFDFAGRVIFISNLAKDKADPDGAIRSRSILIDVNPDDMTLMERIKLLLPDLEPREMALKDKEEIFEFMKRAKDVSMRTFVKAAGFKQAGLPNWERMAQRYL
jgi:hypothetical protein